MDNIKQVQLQLLDQHLAKIQICDRPSDGWICSIRQSLGMRVRQLGERMGITRQTVSRLEHNELDYSITLKL